jgi:hypothetical protein
VKALNVIPVKAGSCPGVMAERIIEKTIALDTHHPPFGKIVVGMETLVIIG